jgi:hypothetical protein
MRLRQPVFEPVGHSGWHGLGVIALAVCACMVLSCSPREAAVGELAVSTSSLTLPFPERSDLTLSWSPHRRLAGLAEPLRVFVHLRDMGGEVLRTFDHPFPGHWEPGRVVQYDLALFQSALGPPLPPGTYDLTIGLYDGAGHRWALDTSGEALARDEYRVATVEVPLAVAPLPRFVADESWDPLQPGSGAQILGRRWLTRSGHLTLERIRSSGTVWIRLWIADATRESRQLVMDPTADQQTVRISTSCGPGEEFLTGTGAHEVRLAIDAPTSTDPPWNCDIQFDADFQVVDLGTLRRRVLQLEVLAWTPLSDLEADSEPVTEPETAPGASHTMSNP